MGEEQARSFRQLVDNLKGLRVLDATQEHHTAVVRMLDRFRGTKLSYTDASSLVHLEQRKIKRVWSTDHHLGVSGAEVLPRS
jgi:predicted nucleic acid-binding protein